MLKSSLLYFWCFLGSFFYVALHPVVGQVLLSDDKPTQSIGDKIDILVDKSKSISYQQASDTIYAHRYKRSQQMVPNFGYASDSYWLRFSITNQADPSKRWLMHFSNPNTDTIQVFVQRVGGELVQKFIAGDLVPFDARPIRYRTVAFPLDFSKDSVLHIYAYIGGYSSKQIPVSVTTEAAFFEQNLYQDLFFMILIGCLLGLTVYNTFIFASLRSKAYAYYSVYLFFFTLGQMSIAGYSYQFLFTGIPYFSNVSFNISVGLATWMVVLFTKSFLNIKQAFPKYYRWHTLFEIPCIAAFLLSVYTVFYPHFIPKILWVVNTASLLSTSYCIILGLIAFLNKQRAARFFLLAWTVLFFTVILSTLKFSGFIPSNFFTDYIFLVGSVAEALLLSMALADRINIIEQEKREAQAATIAALEANEAIIKQQNETLEDRVRDRTKELAEVNAELSTLNEELSQTNEELSSTLHLAEQQRRQLSEKNIEITASISYAKRIQESILPDLNYIRQWLPQHFVLFKPRDIVSGDFYFFLEADKVKFLAAIDCTGHGVPGAFMSLVANDLLNDLILTQHLCRPDLILNALHLGIRKLLKQEETQNRDGMDMALLAIDETHQKVQFAGARNPLWYVSDGQLTEIKGDRMSIGGEQREQERKYTNHLIALEQLNSTTSFYLFSDGFQDQFGGLAGKKFGKTQLRDLLVKIYRQPLDEQRQVLLESFEHWIYEAQEKQIDDMLFIGLRLK